MKGDVHDIGKNIVGVVLGCNNYEVIDLGVMVPCDKILRDRDRARRPTSIGLSGLITPSLDEMVYVAKEMERRGIHAAAAHRRRDDQPAAHGGEDRARVRASRRVHVLDASRVVDVVSSLLSDERRAAFDAKQPRGCRRRCASCTRSAARASRCCRTTRRSANRLRDRLARRRRCREPAFIGRRVLDDVPLEELVPYIDWTFFFAAWELKGRYPGDPRASRSTARRRAICTTARRRCSSGSSTRSCSPRRGVYGFWPARERGRRHRGLHATRRAPASSRASTCCGSRRRSADGKPNLSLADFVAPRGRAACARLPRRVRGHRRHRRRRAGAAVRGGARRLQRDPRQGAGRSAGRGVRRAAARSARAASGAIDDGASARPSDLHRREAPRHPAGVRLSRVPRSQREVQAVRRCSTRAQVGIALTESCAMTPAASVSGLYFAHPQARYFTSGAIGAIRSRTTRSARGSRIERGRAVAGAEPRLRAEAAA